ncbi:MAG: chromosomal replication initiator protein DnaA [Bacteroidota bacterium]|nr:chromosomal replication initiator protein DnaA [Bacteroidota bacterium]
MEASPVHPNMKAAPTSRNLASQSNVMAGGTFAYPYSNLTPVSEHALRTEPELLTESTPHGEREVLAHPGINESIGLSEAASAEESTRNLRSAALQIWKRCLDTLRAQLNPQTMRTWFDPLEAIGLEGAILTLRAPSSFFCEWITEHYEDSLQKSLRDVLGAAAEFRFETTSDLDALNTKLEPASASGILAPPPNGPSGHSAAPSAFTQQYAPQPAQPYSNARPNGQGTPSFGNGQHNAGNAQNAASKRPAIEPNLNPRYTFETFIRGESNKLAYAAANAVANNPGGTRYNPLVIYGNVGLGKTHLIQAVGNAALQKFPSARVLYTSSDRFTVEFVDSIQNNRSNEFQSLYRSIDVLIIDDVQFFAGKEKTQDIFFHTFNALRELGKQIILTCDRAPKELKDIDDRLLNRLQWGLTADIGAPDLETRIAILRHKALADGVELSSEIIEFIASNVTTNIRELEGCLISLLATASLEGKEPTLDLAREVLRKVAKRSTPMLTIETIQRAVAKKFGVEEELLRAKTRKQEVVQARQIAMFLAKELTNHSLKSIGLHFGGRDHSTVIHAVQAVVDDIRHDTGLASKLEDLRRQFEMMH